MEDKIVKEFFEKVKTKVDEMDLNGEEREKAFFREGIKVADCIIQALKETRG